MKTVGIITMHRVLNHGSALQAWATQEAISRLGYDAKIIDYFYPNGNHMKRGGGLKAVATFVLHLLQGFPAHKKRKRYEKFREVYFRLTAPYPTKSSIHDYPPGFDIYVSGSDQIWNPRYTNADGTFFLDFAPEGKRKISYASSFACGTLEADVEEKVAGWLQSFDAISVRERNAVKIIDRLMPGKAVVTCDPTLLLTPEDYWQIADKSIIRPCEPYILVYCLKYAYDPYPYATRLVEEAARQTGLQVLCVDFTSLQKIHAPHVRNFHDGLGPSEFLWLFAHAEMVITTSFHGTAFALNFGKSVYSIVMGGDFGDDRMKSLLHLCGIPERAIPMGTKGIRFDTGMDNAKVQGRLEELRRFSMDFLKENLSADGTSVCAEARTSRP